MKSHPAAEIFPMMSDTDIEALAVDIVAHGQKEPIVTWQGMILDGRNRYQACTISGIEPITVEWDGIGDPIKYVLSLNLHRRHLSESQRSMIAAKIATLKKGDNQHTPIGGTSQTDAAITLNVSDRSVQRAQQVIEQGTPAMISAVEQGIIPVSQAATLAHLPAAKQDEAIKLTKEQRIQVAKEVIAERKDKNKAKLENAKALHAERTTEAVKQDPPIVSLESYESFLSKIAPKSVDMLFTDPPFSTEYATPELFAEFVKSWLPIALSKVKDTGRAYIFIGGYPQELHTYLSVAMPEQVLIWEYKNTFALNPKKTYKQNYQACLYYQGSQAPDLNCTMAFEQWAVQEINAPDGRIGDRYHTWQKPLDLAERFVRHATEIGSTVIDPFCCTGTFLLAASKFGRKASGCDIDPEALKIAIERGCVDGGL